ncbi:branched-chain amino acid ABC transporter permease [Conexibacter sp. CPCC 206217]|uniref:branched-chain amino acid ABC transporter permease n=1 Tax=Conexibacter sp. CPCC 206217 TaxID=3064574 RepID=UPI00271AEB3A|nr:branched-chain amino acid ABC transporter permease [Conexibacter sp. CPCC 206217]MDO8209568.1 branched-chain amino acid ABC transporter permease [Conexibacter sp. CPCC 206217]
MTEIVQRIVDALSVGSTYALLALGLTLVYSVMNLVNFAYGMLLVWAAYAVYVLGDHGVPFALVVPITILFVTVLSVAMGRFAYRPFIGANPITLLITSFGVLLVIQYVAILLFSEGPRVLPLPGFFKDVVHVGGVSVPVVEIVTIGSGIVVVALFWLLMNRTALGAQIRAAAELPDVARLMGVKPDRILMIVFAISGAIAGVVGLLWFAKTGAVTPRSDLDPTLKAFIAIVLGGLGSVYGAVIGGLALGALETIMSVALPDGALSYLPAIVFALVIAILILRPTGLTGRGAAAEAAR